MGTEKTLYNALMAFLAERNYKLADGPFDNLVIPLTPNDGGDARPKLEVPIMLLQYAEK